jgi:hypothetical protein
MKKLANSIEDVGYIIKEIKEESYTQYDMPSSGKKYTGELILKIRSMEDEKAEANKIMAKVKAGEKITIDQSLVGDKEVPF